ncbi:MAG: hypothetical protein M3323_01130 [Actinomycetota bacterium]|nr:hypothetical protein [Actinomycetota bacterium]
MVLLISYDLNGRERPSSYTAVADRIKQKAADWRKPLYSQWFVETTQGPQQWSDWLTPVIDNNDRLFIVRIRTPYQGWLSQADWDWLNSKIL